MEVFEWSASLHMVCGDLVEDRPQKLICHVRARVQHVVLKHLSRDGSLLRWRPQSPVAVFKPGLDGSFDRVRMPWEVDFRNDLYVSFFGMLENLDVIFCCVILWGRADGVTDLW